MDVERWPTNPELLHAALAAGFSAIVAAPIRWEGEMVGMLILATKDASAAERVKARFAYFDELGSFAGSLFGAQAKEFLNRGELRTEVRRVIDEHRYYPVFQPFVDLVSGQVVGYEALTRFEDGRSPDVHFIEAHTIGLGSVLESECASAAIDAARDLDPEVFLSVNFSPVTVLDGHTSATVAHAHRQIVIEITEHAPVED